MGEKSTVLLLKSRREERLPSPSGRRRLGAASRGNVRLLPWIGGLLPNLRRAQRRIAELVVKDPEQFINQPISRLAMMAGVSSGAIVQFCKSLGLKGLPALKIGLARELAEPVFGIAHEAGKRQGPLHIFHQVLHEHIQSLNQTLQLNDASSLDAAAEVLVNARRIVMFSIGLSYPVAYSLYARLRFIGLPAYIEYDSHMQLAAAAEMGRGEVAIGFSLSGCTRETVDCLRLSREHHAHTICVTNSVDSPIARAADIKLYAAPSGVKYFQAPLKSRVSQLALTDTLFAMLSVRRRQRALTHLRRVEEHLLNRRIS